MPGTLQLVQVSKTPIKVQTLLVQNDSVMLVNPDVVNNIFIGNDPGSQIIPVPALGSVTLDTKKHDLWVSTNGGAYTVNAFLMPNGSNWVPSPAQVAAQINALGLAKDTTLTGTTNAVNGVTATLGTPAQTADVGAVNTSLAFGTNPKLDTTITNTSNTNTSVQGLTIGGTPGGVPLLRDTINLGNAIAQSIPANVTTTLLSNVDVTSPAFEASFSLFMPAASGTIPFAVITVTWSDSFTGLQVGRKAYVCPFGNGSGNPITVYLSGPVRGNKLTLTIANRDAAVGGTLTYAFNLTSHLYLVDRYMQPLYPTTAPNGQSQGAGNPSKGLLWESSPTIAASGTATRMTAASNAKCKLNVDIGGSAAGLNITITSPSSTPLYDEAGAGDSFLRVNTPTGNGTSTEFQMPNGPVNINMINQNAGGTVTPKCSLIAMEY